MANLPTFSPGTMIKASEMNQALATLFNRMYPVGSIYMSATLSTPAQVEAALGGTWVAWGAGRVPVGVNTSDSDFSTVEKTGGSKALQSHHHDVRWGSSSGRGATISCTGSGLEVLNISSGWAWDRNTNNGMGSGSNLITSDIGQGNSGNLQPYITCYMYKRTA